MASRRTRRARDRPVASPPFIYESIKNKILLFREVNEFCIVQEHLQSLNTEYEYVLFANVCKIVRPLRQPHADVHVRRSPQSRRRQEAQLLTVSVTPRPGHRAQLTSTRRWQTSPRSWSRHARSPRPAQPRRGHVTAQTLDLVRGMK